MSNKRKHLSQNEKFCIEKMIRAGKTYRLIAACLGRGVSTIAEEINRSGGRWAYSVQRSTARARYKQKYKKRAFLKVSMDSFLCRRVERDLRAHISPERISGRLKRERVPYASAKAIRKFARKRGFERYLYRHGLPHRWKGYGGARNLQFAGRVFVDDPRCKREGVGHWEADFIVSSHSPAVLLVMVDRKEKDTIIRLLPDRSNERVFNTMLEALYGKTVASLTVDNDCAFYGHQTLATLLGVPIYFARPYRSTDKPIVENTNRWIRWFIPKRTDLSTVNVAQVKTIEEWLNNVPRQCLGFLSAREVVLFRTLQTEKCSD